MLDESTLEGCSFPRPPLPSPWHTDMRQAHAWVVLTMLG